MKIINQNDHLRIGAAIARLGLPTALIQEGGYLSDALGANLVSLLEGFERGVEGTQR